jgi:hypothetical protein
MGLRVDVRDHLTRSSTATLLSAQPGATPPTGNRFFIVSFGARNLVFTNAPGVRSTLSGGPINSFRTFEGRGIEHSVTITTGLFWRF